MSKLQIEQKTVQDLFRDKHADFLIPDYQRPYAWTEDECTTLWEDLFAFAIPDGDYEKFNSQTDEYFLGPIVTFLNEDGKLEIIDGQQRLTTLMLLLRAFYEKFQYMKDPLSVKTRNAIASCIWKTNEFDEPDMDQLKIDSQVASDNDKEEFLSILKTGTPDARWKSTYAKNFAFFQEKIDKELIQKWPSCTPYLANRILKNVILLPIEAESQDTALRIFSTLNDRGLPLEDADIFKSKFYKYFSDLHRKDEFVERWKEMEQRARDSFDGASPMDELFTRYMYYERAKLGERNTTTPSLRSFFSRDNYAALRSDEALQSLESLLDFWQRVQALDASFSDEALRWLYILRFAPNGMWTYMVSVYFLSNKDADNNLNNQAFADFLRRLTAMVWVWAVVRPGVNALRVPMYPEMINIVQHVPVTYERSRFTKKEILDSFQAFSFTNSRPFTKSMLAWWAFSRKDQPLPAPEQQFDIEHIYPRRRLNDATGVNEATVELLGNKSLLEKTINIRASDYRLTDKRKYYEGFSDNSTTRPGTSIVELKEIAKSGNDLFTAENIQERNAVIIQGFIAELEALDLIKPE